MRREYGAHNARRGTGILTRAVHSRRDLVAAVRDHVDAVFLSPVFATRSHPGSKTIGTVRLGLMRGAISMPILALGGMDSVKMRRLRGLRLHGWAGIDAWTR